MNGPERITLAMTGASGAQYGLRLLDCLVQEDRRTHEVKRYEIMNCTYRELSGKISKKHAPAETPSC